MNKELADGLRNLVVVIDTDGSGTFTKDGTTITLNNPWQEFEYTVTSDFELRGYL